MGSCCFSKGYYGTHLNDSRESCYIESTVKIDFFEYASSKLGENDYCPLPWREYIEDYGSFNPPRCI